MNVTEQELDYNISQITDILLYTFVIAWVRDSV